MNLEKEAKDLFCTPMPKPSNLKTFKGQAKFEHVVYAELPHPVYACVYRIALRFFSTYLDLSLPR